MKKIKERLLNSGTQLNFDYFSETLWNLQQKLSRNNLENTKEYKLASELKNLLVEASKCNNEVKCEKS